MFQTIRRLVNANRLRRARRAQRVAWAKVRLQPSLRTVAEASRADERVRLAWAAILPEGSILGAW